MKYNLIFLLTSFFIFSKNEIVSHIKLIHRKKYAPIKKLFKEKQYKSS